MGFRSAGILHLRNVDLVVVFVRSKPFDPNDTLLEIHRYHEAISSALDVEDDALRSEKLPAWIGTRHIKTLFGEPPASPPAGRPGDAELLGNGHVVQSLGRQQGDPR